MDKKVEELQKFIRTLSVEKNSMKRELSLLLEHKECYKKVEYDLDIEMILDPQPDGLLVQEPLAAYLPVITEKEENIRIKIRQTEELETKLLKWLEHKLSHMTKKAKKQPIVMEKPFDSTAPMLEKIKYAIVSADELQSIHGILSRLKAFGENIKPNTDEFEEEYKKSAASIAAVLKIYSDKGELARCKIDGLYHYGDPTWFNDKAPLDEYIPEYRH